MRYMTLNRLRSDGSSLLIDCWYAKWSLVNRSCIFETKNSPESLSIQIMFVFRNPYY